MSAAVKNFAASATKLFTPAFYKVIPNPNPDPNPELNPNPILFFDL